MKFHHFTYIMNLLILFQLPIKLLQLHSRSACRSQIRDDRYIIIGDEGNFYEDIIYLCVRPLRFFRKASAFLRDSERVKYFLQWALHKVFITGPFSHEVQP